MPQVTQRQFTFDEQSATLAELWKERADGRFLQAVNQLLAEERQKAHPYEAINGAHKPYFMGAALTRTADGEFFTGTNQHVHQSPAYNDCAEKSAMMAALQGLGRAGFAITDVWFMGGKGLGAEKPIANQEQGKHYTPCGSCRDMIENFSVEQDQGAMVHILPLNDGRNPIVEAQVNRYPIFELMPQRRAKTATPEQIERLLAGLEFLLEPRGKDTPAHKEIASGLQRSLTRVEAELRSKKSTDASDIMKEVNKAMHRALAKAYGASRKTAPLHSATICVVRTDEGKYFLATNLENGVNRSTVEAEFTASAVTENHPITDAFILKVDFAALEKLKHHPTGALPLPTPTSSALERLRKAGIDRSKPMMRDTSPFAGTGQPPAAYPRIHLLSLNNPRQFSPRRDMESYDITQLLPHAFEGLKVVTGRGR